MDTAIIYLSYRICKQRLVIKETGEVYDFHSEAIEIKKTNWQTCATSSSATKVSHSDESAL